MKQRQWKPRGRMRRALRRSSVVWWTGAVVLSLVTASIVSGNLSRAAREADGWGTQRPVWVVRRAVPAGDVVVAADVTLSRRPKRVVPLGALGASASPVGDATRVALVPGEFVVGDRLAARGVRGLAALVAPGYRAVAVPVDDASPQLRAGDRVDVIATFDVGDALEQAGEEARTPAVAVAANAAVIAVTPKAATLAVTSREAPRVAFALARAAVTLSLRGGASEPARSR